MPPQGGDQPGKSGICRGRRVMVMTRGDRWGAPRDAATLIRVSRQAGPYHTDGATLCVVPSL